MGVWLSDNTKYWKTGIPYTANGMKQKDEESLIALIDAFNRTIKKEIFRQWKDEDDYVEFKLSVGYSAAASPVGKQGGKQLLLFTFKDLYHEMGHCCGLGHEHYQPHWELEYLLGGLDKDDYNKQTGDQKYANNNKYNIESVMCYPLGSLSTSQDLNAVLTAINAEARQQQRRSSLGAKPKAKINITQEMQENIKRVSKYMRSKNANNMRLHADDIKIIRDTLCPNAKVIQ